MILERKKSINRRNPANANMRACRGTDGIDVVVVDNHRGNSKTNRCGVKKISWIGEGSFVGKLLDSLRDT